MLRFVRRHRLGFLITVLLSTYGLGFAMYALAPSSQWHQYCATLYFFLAAGLYQYAFYHGSRSAVHALEELCDPFPLADFAYESIERERKGRSIARSERMTAHLYMSTALASIGRYEDALLELDAIAPLPDGGHTANPTQPGRREGSRQIVWALNRASVLGALDLAKDMANALDQAQELLDTTPLKPDRAATYAHVLHGYRLAYRLLTEGPGPEVEGEYEALLAQAQNESQRVNFHVSLGKCALARGDKAAARTHLEYAAAHGNKLYLRCVAEDLLPECAAYEN